METRQAPRLALKLKVSIGIDSATKKYFDILKKNIEGEMVDISMLGLGLLSRNFFPVGAVLKLSFILPFRRKEDDVNPINVRGEVRWAISGGRGLTKLGIKFLDLTNADKEKISAFIKGDESRRQKS